MRINRNISAVLVNDQLLRNEDSLSASIERLSSGFKLNHAKDNPSGMAISYKMQAQINALDRASANTTDGLSIVQTIDGSIGEMNEIAQRMRELCVQAANDTNTQEDKKAIQLEIDSLKKEFNRISNDTEFNGKSLLDGSLDRRTYVTNADKSLSYYDKVSNILISDSVQSGMYQIDVTASGTRARQSLTANITDPAGQTGAIMINGVEAGINADMTPDEVENAIRDAAEQGGVELEISGNQYTFVQDRAGSAYSIDISFSNDDVAGLFGSSASDVLHAVGTEADVQISTSVPRTDENGDPVLDENGVQIVDTISDFSPEATTLIDGNQVVIRDKSGFEMSFDLSEDIANATYYIEATDIGTLQLQVGANEDQELAVRVPILNTKSLYIDDLDVTKVGGADRGIAQMDEAMSRISAARSKMGAYENSLEYAQKSLDANNENMTQAISRLADTDMAEEMTTYANKNVLNQASISILSQANDMPQQVLSLLQF